MSKEELPKSNFIVREEWTVECPYDTGDRPCFWKMEAPFNEANPMSPMQITCEHCGRDFILTYERD